MNGPTGPTAYGHPPQAVPPVHNQPSGPPPGWHLDYTGTWRWWTGTSWAPTVRAPAPVKVEPPVASQLATWLGLGLGLVAAAVAAVAVLVAGLVMASSPDSSINDISDVPTGLFVALLVVSSLAMWAVFTLAFDLARRRCRLTFPQAIGWTSPWRLAGIGVLVGIALRWPLAALEIAFLGRDAPAELLGLLLADLALPLLVLLGLTVVVGAPVFEELFFRGLMLPTLSRPWPLWAAVAVSSCIFGVLHLGQPLLALVYITLVGAALAITRIRTKSLIPCVVAHAVFNGTSFLMAVALA